MMMFNYMMTCLVIVTFVAIIAVLIGVFSFREAISDLKYEHVESAYQNKIWAYEAKRQACFWVIAVALIVFLIVLQPRGEILAYGGPAGAVLLQLIGLSWVVRDALIKPHGMIRRLGVHPRRLSSQ